MTKVHKMTKKWRKWQKWQSWEQCQKWHKWQIWQSWTLPILYPENTSNDDPITNKMSQLLTKSRTFCTRGLGTLSPKNITSGFKQSLWHLGQVAKVKRSTSSGLSSTSPSGRTSSSRGFLAMCGFKLVNTFWNVWRRIS